MVILLEQNNNNLGTTIKLEKWKINESACVSDICAYGALYITK